MSTTYLLSQASGNPNLDAVFDPYVQGTNPSTIDLLNDQGVDLSQSIYAPLSFGSAAAATGLLDPAGADLNTLFAAKGTAAYTLPINGKTYSITESGTANGKSVYLEFDVLTGSTWATNAGGSLGVTNPVGIQDSGNLPAGAATVMYSATKTSGNPTFTNGAATATAVSSNPSIKVALSQAGSTAVTASATVTVIFYNSGGTAISTTTYTVDLSVTAN